MKGSAYAKRNRERGGPFSTAPYTPGTSLYTDSGKVYIRPFEVELSLSEKALTRLNAGRETLVAFYFAYGEKKTGLSAEEEAYFAEGFAFSGTLEYPLRRRLRIERVEVPKRFFRALAGENLTLHIDFISGRKSTSENLIVCDVLSGTIEQLVGRRFFLEGKLIGE